MTEDGSHGFGERRLHPEGVTDLYRLPDGRLTVLASDHFLVLTGAAAEVLELVVSRPGVGMKELADALGEISGEDGEPGMNAAVHSLVEAGLIGETPAP